MVNLKFLLKYSKEDSLIRDGIILLVATMIANFAAFLYHVGMGNLLPTEDYGILGAILSLLYLLLVPFNVIQTSISKFTAKFKAENKEEKIKYLFYFAFKNLVFVGIILMIVFIVLDYFFISRFLKISNNYILFVAIIIPFIFLLPINRGLFQGLQNFKKLGINMIIEAFTKLSLGFLLVFLGFGLRGAIIGVAASYVIPFIISFIQLKGEYSKNEEDIGKNEIYKYSIPVLITLSSLTAFYSLDVILVKHYFTDVQSGYYTAIALLGRIVFFASLAISIVMFPKVAEMEAMKKSNKPILNKSLFIVALISVFITTIYFIFPKLVITLFFFKNKSYLALTNYIGPFALLMSFFSLSYLLAIYNLSINRIKFIYILVLFNLLEVLAIFFVHDTFTNIIIILNVIMFLMFIALGIYTIKNERTINNNTSL